MKESSSDQALPGTTGCMQSGSTPIFYGLSSAEVIADWVKAQNYSQIAILYDSNTQLHYRAEMERLLPDHHPIHILAGESAKTLETCSFVGHTLASLKMDRKSVLINLGGGVVGDLGGFVASTYQRGIHFVQVPTTLLAMVDASVGGKVGVNLGNLKNHVGAFSNPDAVFIHTGFLKTLSEREILSGFAEMLKHSLIGNPDQWSYFMLHQEAVWSPQLIADSVKIKIQIVEADPFERGLRKGLNFGHTVGHALESWFMQKGKDKLLHGEAIAIGLVCEAWIAYQREKLGRSDYQEIRDYIQSLYPSLELNSNDLPGISALALHDKKNEAGLINCTLLKGIGDFEVNVPISRKEIEDSLHTFCDI